jgi:hypothetical protein
MPTNCFASQVGRGLVLLFAGVGLAACEGDFATDPARPRVVRDLGSPYGVSDASSEVMRVDSGAFSIVTVDIPNSRHEPSVAHWGEPLPTYFGSQGAAPQTAVVPETKPATASAPAKEDIKVVGPQKPADFFSISRDNAGNADLWVTNPSGTGSVTLEREIDAWPALIRVHFRYHQDQPFTHLERFTAAEALPAEFAAEGPKAVTSAPAGAIGPGIVGGGKISLKSTFEKYSDLAQVSVPGFSRARRIEMNWVDIPR